jgi:T5orf172 domain
MPAIKEEELAEQTSRLAISEKGPCQKPASPGLFSPQSHEERLWIKETVKKIGKAVTTKDLKPGILYVAKSAGSRFIKVGFSSRPNESRPQEVATACGVAFEKAYRTTSIYCSFRAEQIVHDVLVDWAHDRLECKCGKVNREWYRKDFGYIIALVNLVHTWIAQEPYDFKGTKALKDE